MTGRALARRVVEITVDGVDLKLQALWRDGPEEPFVFLHGFGSTKEDYADIERNERFDRHGFLAYDAPGCGESECADLSRISIPFLVATAQAMLAQFGIERFHLGGHSMGGLTALQLAIAEPRRPLSFSDIEGNVAPEDCFLSRQILDFPDDDPERFFARFVERVEAMPLYGHRLYGASLRAKVRAEAVAPIFRSMVEISDHGDLMTHFLNLPFPRMFCYGEQNRGLSYLPTLREHGVTLAEIPHAAHFPMYSNPPAMWRAIADFTGAGVG